MLGQGASTELYSIAADGSGRPRRFYQDALGPMSDKEALVIDTRWNGGGWLHDDLAAFLQGELYLTFVPRGKEPGSFDGESMMRWTRPSAVLQNEANYSDGHISPWVIHASGAVSALRRRF